jgi:hypothetical protein
MNRTLIAHLGTAFVLILVLSLTAGPLLAHHGRGASYDNSKIMTIQGTISEWAYRNPHAALYVDVKEPDGKVVNWGFESQNVSSLSRLKIFRNTFHTGQQVTIKFNPSRGGAPVGVIRKVYDMNGKELLSFGGPIDE